MPAATEQIPAAKTEKEEQLWIALKRYFDFLDFFAVTSKFLLLFCIFLDNLLCLLYLIELFVNFIRQLNIISTKLFEFQNF